jgi:hypothetical protein
MWSVQQIPTAVNFGFIDRRRYFLEIAPQYHHNNFNYFSEKYQVAPKIEPGPVDLNPGTLTTRLQSRSVYNIWA